MADRKQMPDIMGGLLNGSAGKKAPEVKVEPDPTLEAIAKRKSELTEALEAATSETASQQPGKPARQPRAKPAKRKASKAPPPETEEKAKCTFYLSQETLDALEDGWLQLRRLARDRASVSKSSIVETALQIALEELAKQGERSELAGRLAED